MTKLKSFFFAASALTLVFITACSNAAQIPDAGTGGSAALPEAPFVEGGASLILSPNKLNIKVKVTTSDGTPVTVEGCTETTLLSGTETVLHAQGTVVILKGKIIKLNCHNNQLTELNVQGLTALQSLGCSNNKLTALNVQGLSALQHLKCGYNKLSADALTKLFNDLPQRTVSQDAKCYLYTCHRHLGIIEEEGNHKDFTSPGELKNAFDNAKTVKNWKMYKWDNGWGEL